jgi:organic radical activating enzyme
MKNHKVIKDYLRKIKIFLLKNIFYFINVFCAKFRKGEQKEGEFRLGSPDAILVIRFLITDWCNYSCGYCNDYKRKVDSSHAFTHYPLEQWIAAFGSIPYEFILEITGGEPFLDQENFMLFLKRIASMDRCKILRINTNGSCIPKIQDFNPQQAEKLKLNISYHPTQISFDLFKEKINEIVSYGWDIEMINYVMERDQRKQYEEIRDYFSKKFDIYVNPNPNFYEKFTKQKKKEFSRYLCKNDLLQKTGAITSGKICYFPSIGYNLMPDGVMYRACVGKEPIDFIRNSKDLRLSTQPAHCPLFRCVCLDMYAFLDDFPKRGKRLNLLREYIEANRKHQEQFFPTLNSSTR